MLECDEIVYRDNDYLVIRFPRPFATGFNVYKLEDDGVTATKQNDEWSFFKTLDSAIAFLEKKKSARI